MRTAIQATNVNLDLVIIPGIALVPSKMIILDKPIRGYDNLIRTATKTM